MKVIKFYYLYIGIICLFSSCYKNEIKDIDKKTSLVTSQNAKQKTNISEIEKDTSKVGILVMKENKTIEDQLLMLKNAAFCSCIGIEENKIKEETNKKYVPIPDGSYTGYMNYSNLGEEIFLKNPKLDKLIEKWSQKQYDTEPTEDENSKTYMLYMKCLDFYNSKELNDYIDSIGHK